ncbi:MAG: HD domain-containing phosphohydrolase [Gemmatimonadales bacterium]
MSLTGSVLLVDDDPAALASYAAILSRHPNLRVVEARSGAEGLEAARIHRPDVVVSDLRMAGMDGAALCRAVRADPSLEGTLFVFLTAVADPLAEIDPATGFDDLLLKPATAAEFGAKVGAMLRLKRLHDQLRADKLEMERLHREMGNRFDQLLDLLVRLVDLSVPGAAARSVDTTRLAANLATRFEVPEVLLKDLEISARIHEIGKLILGGDRVAGDGPEDVIEGDHWRYAVAARNLLGQVAGLEGAAELIGAIFENWDGTGHPDRLRQGQVPLRSRILRLVIDYLATQASDRSDPVSAIESLQHHAGTRYDPLAVAYLDALVRASATGSDWKAARVHVPIPSLAEGMVLADDLFTASGVKLLAKGSTLAAGTLETILRRHRSDPMVHGAWVERSSLEPT